MNESRVFLAKAQQKSADEIHRLKIQKAIATYDIKVKSTKNRQFYDWQKARKKAAQIKDDALANLPDLLLQFEENTSKNGTHVLWAENALQARQHIRDIIKKHHAEKIVKSKSMTTEEIELNEFLDEMGVENWESDLGEFIVQLANEKPYHIVTPAMHKSQAEIAELFSRKLGIPATGSAEELTMAARAALRQTFVTADIGITGANFIIADTGAIVMTENEGNGRLCMACPKVHIAIVGIEKMLPRLSDLALFLPLLATSGTGQQLSCYNSIIRGPKAANEADGPEKMVVILLDNRRSEIYAQDKFRHVLRCLRCGACLNACPVFRTVGGHTYGTAYQGPIGSVLTPHLRGMKNWSHLAHASSLCGACSDVCPVDIDLHHLLLENRWQAEKEKTTPFIWQIAIKIWAWLHTNRLLLQFVRPILKLGIAIIKPVLPAKKKRRLPQLAKKSFAQMWTTAATKSPKKDAISHG
ncbi:MAG: iron-sulfur cluster-binding protein [Calditrichaeota bacterium]|nr:MAG: iron-sulfur cluster-binding protein [Calditrichota bacterium]